MKKVLISIVMACSVVLSVFSYRTATNTFKLISGNIEALSDDEEEPEIVCGRNEGLCWAGVEESTYGKYRWDCYYWTGYTFTTCKHNQAEFNWSVDFWITFAQNNGLIP